LNALGTTNNNIHRKSGKFHPIVASVSCAPDAKDEKGQVKMIDFLRSKYDTMPSALPVFAIRVFTVHSNPFLFVKNFSIQKHFCTLLAVMLIFGGWHTAYGQVTPVKPFLQPLKVEGNLQPQPTPDDLVKKTSSVDIVKPAPPISYSPIRTTIPILETTPIPGYSGVLVETIDGEVVVESGSNLTYNPASNVKIATAYAVLKAFGPDMRFATNLWTDGSYEESTATIHGNLYFSGVDPVFGFEHAILIAEELNRIGIRAIQGDIIVTENFSINHLSSSLLSARTLANTLDAKKRSASSRRFWENFKINTGTFRPGQSEPSVEITGNAGVGSLPPESKLIFTHESAPLRDILKGMLAYSNNAMAEKLGQMVGGPFAIAEIVRQDIGALPGEFYIQTASGLGINRVTPAAMMKLLRALRNRLAMYNMTFADIFPVAGIDKGTLEGRFDSDFSKGSVVGKTGTLGQTDGGVSALAGEVNTRSGLLLFVIFNQRGSVARFRAFQNNYIAVIQGQFGGPVPIGYNPDLIDVRLAKSRFRYPNGAVSGI
jgi:D-alanyl-D-alanine carboxypeptidase/D-alanyl-D-alanine-endopeptidase (penicillin-binding protein 4)